MKQAKKANRRAFVSIALFIIFALLILSAVMIQIIEIRHRFSFAHHVWTAIHVLCGVVFTIAGIFHIVYNWRSLAAHVSNVKGTAVKAAAVAFLLVIIIVAAGFLAAYSAF
ncbi:MAG: DUF4405 domain-containing protein [Bacteroidales bacterium]|jgi:hypothetical protein|nr:DUF4405 domain-containing protein [Bacteroidales bacterium]